MGSFRGVCQSSCHLSSLLQKPSLLFELFLAVVYSVPHRHTLDTRGSSLVVQQMSVIDLHYWDLLHFKTNTSEMLPTVNELYLYLHTVNHDGLTFIDTRSERFYVTPEETLELTQATPNQPVDEEVVYYKVASECPRGRVYGLRSLGRKKRRYADPGASTSQMPKMVSCSEFDSVAEQLRQGVAFMQRQFGMAMYRVGLSQPHPPSPPPPHEQQ
ncbi:hypothetical protein Scep_007026 [Stephania cephalantha]|uniref:Uncharacterized protein n=1 Tax=Stephania cephalantha TaxID=152367 RepID=A0AAP0PMT7_9MAGN